MNSYLGKRSQDRKREVPGGCWTRRCPAVRCRAIAITTKIITEQVMA
jgi:hypothetical protein